MLWSGSPIFSFSISIQPRSKSLKDGVKSRENLLLIPLIDNVGFGCWEARGQRDVAGDEDEAHE
jgi:hypothetical protein